MDGTLRQIAGERGLLWDPVTEAVPSAVVRLVDSVEDLAGGLGAQGRRWLSAALAVLSEDIEDTTGHDPRIEPGPATAVAVVAASVGVLAGRRRDETVLGDDNGGRSSFVSVPRGVYLASPE